MALGKTNPLESLFELTARLPWWTGVVAALFSGAFFYLLSRIAVPVAADSVLQSLLWPALRGLAVVLQYVLPLLFLGGAALSAWQRYKHHSNYRAVAGERGRAALELLSWREFENLVCEFFRRKGFSVEQRGRREPGGGVDLVAAIGEDRYLVQCKHWRVQRVGVKVVRELCDVAAAEGAAGVFVVTSGSFTDEAGRFVEEHRIDIELITGEQLRQMIQGLEAVSPTTKMAAPSA